MKKVLLVTLSILNQVLNASGYININVFGTGLFLPYSIGVIGYIKKHVNITDKTDYRINGISGGAWCSLLYTQEDDLSDHDKIWDYAIGGELTNIKLQNDMKTFQENVENNLKNRYKNRDAKKYELLSIEKKKILPIVGCEFQICHDRNDKTYKDNGYQIPFLAKNKKG